MRPEVIVLPATRVMQHLNWRHSGNQHGIKEPNAEAAVEGFRESILL